MIFDWNEKKEVVVLLGAGGMEVATVRRIAAGKKFLLGDSANFITSTDLLMDGGVITSIRAKQYSFH